MPRSVTRYALLMCFDEIQALQPARALTRKAFIKYAHDRCPAFSLTDDKVHAILRKHSVWPKPRERHAVFQLLDVLTQHRKHDRTLFATAVQLGLNFDAAVQKMLESKHRRQVHIHALTMHQHLATSLAEGLTKNKELAAEQLGPGLILLHLIALAASYEMEDLAQEAVADLSSGAPLPAGSRPTKDQSEAFKAASTAIQHSLKTAGSLQRACSRLGYVYIDSNDGTIDSSTMPWPTLWFFVCANTLESNFLQSGPGHRQPGNGIYPNIWNAWDPTSIYPRVVIEALSSQVLRMLIEASGHAKRHGDVLQWWLHLTRLDKQFCKGPHFRPKVWVADIDTQNNQPAMTDDPNMELAVGWIRAFQSQVHEQEIGWHERGQLEALAIKLAN